MSGIVPMAFGIALREYALAELDAALTGLGRRGGRIHAGVHRTRKAVRRTRATLALGGQRLEPGASLLGRELKRLNDGLSVLRDAQALVEVLDRQIPKSRKPEDQAVLRRARRAAAATRARCAAEQASNVAALRALLPVLRAGLTALPWEAVTEPDLQEAVQHSAARIAKAHARVQRTQDDENWHRWRRRMRRFSQQLRALDAAGLEVSAPSSFDKSLAEQLGVAQDLRLLIERGGNLGLRKRDRANLTGYAEGALNKQRKRINQIDGQLRDKPGENGPGVG